MDVCPQDAPPMCARLLCVCADDTLKASLTSPGLGLDIAPSPLAALEALQKSAGAGARYRAVLVDLALPDDQALFFAALAHRPKDAAFHGIPFAALGEAAQAAEAHAAGFEALLPRDVGGPGFELALASFLGGLATLPEGVPSDLPKRLLGRLDGLCLERDLLEKRIRAANDIKNELLAMIAYELSVPFTPVLGYLKILSGEQLGTLTERQKEVLDATERLVARMAHTLDALSDFSTLEGGRYRLHVEPLRPGTLIENLIDHFQVLQARAKHVQIRLDSRIDEEDALCLVADPDRFRQAVLALLEYALQRSPRGGRVQVQLGLLDGEQLELTVRDQGGPLKPDELKQLFNPFGRRHDARPFCLDDLGLPIAQKISEEHGGSLMGFEIDPGTASGGLCLRLILPLTPAPNRAPSPAHNRF